MSLELESRQEILKSRAQMLGRIRHFFMEKKILEVDVPILHLQGAIDEHIDLIAAVCNGKRCYLHSSPEYHMKCLLAEGLGDIYQLSHVFRDNEKGMRHNPEFLMAEWYRVGFSLEEMIQETLAFSRLFLDDSAAVEILTYREAFLHYLGFYPAEEERDKLFALEVEPHLGKENFTVLWGYPPNQAALAKTTVVDGEEIALRFEVFYQGLELANGYQELTDPKEQRRRMELGNQKRLQGGKTTYPLDHRFLQALEKGIPNCCGVAVGVDRLMMLRHQKKDIAEVLPFAWESL